MKIIDVTRGSFKFSHVEKTPWYRRDKQWWVIENPYFVTVEFEDNSHGQMEVEKGYLTDGASVPRMLWWLFPPHGPYSAAAFFHDKQYKLEGLVAWRAPSGAIMTKHWTRRRADDLFKEVMLFLGLRQFRAKTMYQAVRKFGPRW